MENFMNAAIKEACLGVGSNDGGPFGAVVVRDGEILASGHNLVISTNDPTAHAEVSAIRNACKKLNNFNLEGCILYTSCYPCPMCMGAVLWSGIKEVYYAATSEDAESVGFGDKIYHDFVKAPEKGAEMCKYTMIQLPNKLQPFQQWAEKVDKVPY
ncbi:putative guanine deaminase [Aphelenchoides bicaudatus]|nr:putative guanine deaminase [Aphelenchoides bicaudatus]